ncbi:hypothetical protein BX283_0179 [Streptomyces sp. TLI_146]|nr:hypothetical protein BX283_0179 [Streptomyces sp. TLI_146]
MGEDRLLVHPGQLAHPLLFLRSLKLTAGAVDGPLRKVVGFGVEDVLELALRLSDRSLRALSAAWPEPNSAGDSEEAGPLACEVTAAEVYAAAEVARADPQALVSLCRCPERAGRALQWLTCRIEDLKLRYHPEAPLLGPVLALSAHGRCLPVPACAATDAVAPAVARLLSLLPPDALKASEARMQDLTVGRLARLLGLDTVPARPGPVCVLSSPSHRYDIAIVSAVAESSLATRLEEGRAALADTAQDRGRLVVYGGPRFLGPELVYDTLYLHVEEVAEILHDAEGNLALLALFVLELTQHPGIHGIGYRDALTAWSAWHRTGALLVPGPDGDNVAGVATESVRDEVWDRAAAWSGVDEVLAAVQLPPAEDFLHTRLSPAQGGAAGTYADLDHATPEGLVMVRAATLPPLVIVAVPDRGPGAILDVVAMSGLAESLRTTFTTLGPVVTHATLPHGAPLLVQMSVARQAHAHPASPQSPTPPCGMRSDGERGSEEWLLLRSSVDADTGRIGIEIDPPLLAAFSGDGREGHAIVGRLLHHLIEQVRLGRGAKPGTGAEAFSAAWNSTHPVLRLTAATHAWPATAPAFTLPNSPHVHARALRAAAAAVRSAEVPAGSWRGPDAYRRGGPGEQLLHALEGELDQQIRAFQPSLMPELARQLNAAWADRTRSAQQSAVNLATPWAENWTYEAHRRQADGARSTTALQLLLQHALTSPPSGERAVDVLAIADLAALAELVLRSGLTAVAASRRLHDLRLDIAPSGVFTLTTGPDTDDTDADSSPEQHEHLGFDADAYHQARQQLLTARLMAAEPALTDGAAVLAAPPPRTEVAFTPPELPAGSQLARADRLLHEEWGCGFSALGAVLATAADWPTDPDGIAAVTTEDLAAEAASWSDLPASEIRAAVARLRLHTGNAAGSGSHPYTEVERRSRPLIQPLITVGDTLLVLPWLACAARDAYAAYLDGGRLPHPDLPDKITQALLRHRQQLDKHLEREIAEAVRAAGYAHRSPLLEKTARAHGIHELAGEIDLLVADPTTGRLWVIEAKNPTPAIAAPALLQHIKKFTRDYCDKLLAKTATLAAHPHQAASLCGITPAQNWRVLPLIVTRTVEPSAFLADPRLPYTTAERLTAVLANPTDPEPGWIPA